MKREISWKLKFERLRASLQDLADVAQFRLDDSRHIEDEQPPVCISDSDEFFISNDMQCVDNEKYAKEHWGPGCYFRVVKDPCILAIDVSQKKSSGDSGASK